MVEGIKVTVTDLATGESIDRLYAYRSTDPRNNDRGHYADSVDALGGA